jgi:hypothetical protein
MIVRMSVVGAVVFVVGACARPEPAADSTNLAPAGAVQPLDSSLVADTTSRVGAANPTPTTRSPAVKADTPSTKTTPPRRDSVIPFDRTDPRRRVPTIPDTSRDTTPEMQVKQGDRTAEVAEDFSRAS